MLFSLKGSLQELWENFDRVPFPCAHVRACTLCVFWHLLGRLWRVQNLVFWKKAKISEQAETQRPQTPKIEGWRTLDAASFILQRKKKQGRLLCLSSVLSMSRCDFRHFSHSFPSHTIWKLLWGPIFWTILANRKNRKPILRSQPSAIALQKAGCTTLRDFPVFSIFLILSKVYAIDQESLIAFATHFCLRSRNRCCTLYKKTSSACCGLFVSAFLIVYRDTFSETRTPSRLDPHSLE